MKKMVIFWSFALLWTMGLTLTACSDEPEKNPEPVQPHLHLSPNGELHFDALGGEKHITVESHTQWEIDIDTDWCQYTQTATGFDLHVGENNAAEERLTQITVTAGTESAQLTVRQAGAEAPIVTTTFELELGEPDVHSVHLRVRPSNPEAIYYFDVLSCAILEEHHQGELTTYMHNLMQNIMEEQGSIEAALERIASTGEQEYTFTNLSPDTPYVAFAVGLDEQGELNTEIASETFCTLPMPEICSWEVTFDAIYYDGLTFTVTPSDPSIGYYFTVRPTASYGEVMTDAELLEAILMEDGMMLDYYAVSDTYTSEYDMQEFICCADTGYEVLIFAYADGEALSAISRFPFRTLGSEFPAEECTFSIQVSDPTPNGAHVEIIPSDLHQMYLWDVVQKSELESEWENDITTYVEAYIAYQIETMGLYEIDFIRVMGEEQNTFGYEFDAATEYVVWAVCVDEYGQIGSEIATAPFRTTETEVEAQKRQSHQKEQISPFGLRPMVHSTTNRL